jgi:hypothetical protein
MLLLRSSCRVSGVSDPYRRSQRAEPLDRRSSRVKTSLSETLGGRSGSAWRRTGQERRPCKESPRVQRRSDDERTPW